MDTCLYQCVDGVIISCSFDSKQGLPDDWHDSPVAAEKAARPKKRKKAEPKEGE